ncbi:MAG: type III-B CRISPR module RAMP protein Cmr1 [Candidatus Brocadia sp.]|jgi:CRISPR-associated protein Cmr1
MNSITFECEIITPMFLAGVDGKAPELRPPSIKGMMRFWWRAIKAENNIEKLGKEEGKLFGSSDEKIGKSKFLVRIIANNLTAGDFSPVPHRTKKFEFKGFNAGQRFSIIISGKDDITNFKIIYELSVLLGGLGKRSRRGFGSVHCESWNFTNNNGLIQFILNKLNSIQNDFCIKDMKIFRKASPKANYPFIREISLGKPEKDPFDLLTKIGNASHQYNDPSLGYAGKISGNPIRMASPIYVSIAKLGNEFIPIITTLNSAFPSSYPSCNMQKQQQFRGSI